MSYYNMNYGHIETGSYDWTLRCMEYEEFERMTWLDDNEETEIEDQEEEQEETEE